MLGRGLLMGPCDCSGQSRVGGVIPGGEVANFCGAGGTQGGIGLD